MSDASNQTYEIIMIGDFNINRHPPKDPLKCPELCALTPILENFMMDHGMTQTNHKPTQHEIGQKRSILDLIISNIPG